MDELWEEIDAEKELIENTLAELANALQRRERSYVVLAGVATFVHNLYNSIENILKRMLTAKGKSLDTHSSFWHQELLQNAVDEKIISSQLATTLKSYLGFRHFFVHAYGVRLDTEQLLPLAINASKVWQDFYAGIEAAFQALKHQGRL